MNDSDKPSPPKKAKRGVAHIVRRAKLPAKKGAGGTPRKGLAHIVRRKESSDELKQQGKGRVEFEKLQTTSPILQERPKGKSVQSAGSNLEEFTVEEARPSIPKALAAIADKNALTTDPDRGYLKITSGKDTGRRIGLWEGRTTIGRGLHCDIVLTDPAVSREHAYVERRGNVYLVCDLKSGNGTLVNDRPATNERLIVDGDRFRMGNTVFCFEGVENSVDAPETVNWRGKEASFKDHPPASGDEPSTMDGKGRITASPEPIVAAPTFLGPEPSAEQTHPKARTPSPTPEDDDDNEETNFRDPDAPLNKTGLGQLPSQPVPPTPSPNIPYPLQPVMAPSMSPPAIAVPLGSRQPSVAPPMGRPPQPYGFVQPQPAHQVQPVNDNKKLLVGFAPVAGVLVAIVVIAMLVGRMEDGDSTPAPSQKTEKVASGTDDPQTEPEAEPGTEPQAEPEPAQNETNEAEDDDLKGLIAGNTPMNAATWGNDERFLQGVVDESTTRPDVAPTPEQDTPSSSETEEVKEQPKIVESEPKEEAKAKEPKSKSTENRTRRAVKEPKTKPPKAKVPDRPKPSRGTAGIRAEALGQYKRRDFRGAESTLKEASYDLDGPEAEKLLDLAAGYRQVGSFLDTAEEDQTSDPINSLKYYKKALERDKQFGGGTHASLIRVRIGQVAVKAARLHMSKKNYAQAKSAADAATRYKQGDAVESVYSSLEREAKKLLKKALRARDRGDDREAKRMLMDVIKMAPKGSDAGEDARAEMRDF
jgi:pSer/pThr/pTyr-binding forkhead associated (FHA) protein/tetratricopeptide (TPR) repeat protein